MQVINRCLFIGTTGAILGGSYFLAKNPPDLSRFISHAEKIWTRFTALRNL